jgi:rhodanese-related sulfurtransferase
MHHSPGFLKLTSSARKKVSEISVSDLKNLKRGENDVVLIDVREDREWDNGRIAGSIHLGRGILERDIEKRVPQKKAPIVLYCGGGYRSVLAAESLKKMGYRNVASLRGGWKAWKESKGSVVKP